jgi:cysteine-rich repeat protein
MKEHNPSMSRPSRTLMLSLTVLTAFACDPNDGSAPGSGGQGGASGAAGGGGSAGQAGARYVEISPNRFKISRLAASAGGGSGGPSGGGGGMAGTGGALPMCTLQVPSGAPPATPTCGDGFRGGTEECDDWNTLPDDACSATCTQTSQLVSPRPPPTMVGLPPLRARELGGARHPLAAGCNSVAASFVDYSGDLPALSLAIFNAVGKPTKVMPVASVGVDKPGPAVAALGDDSFAVAWTDFTGDGDELEVRLTKLIPSATTQPASVFANAETAFSQRAPDVVFDGSKLIVAWVDDLDASNGPDIRYRTFAPDLTPISAEQTLAATAAVEDHVSLAARNGAWAAAWRSGSAGLETLEIQSGAVHWTVGPYKPGAASDLPALAFIDASHLVVAFTMVNATESDQHAPRLHAAVLDANYPGQTGSFALAPTVAPYATDSTLAQSQPSLVAFADRLVVSWRSEAVPGAALGEELWKRDVTWSFDAMGDLLVDASAAEVPLLTSGYRAGDQSEPVLLNSPFWPEHRVFSAWQDWGKTFGTKSGVADVGIQVVATPDPTCSASIIVSTPGGPVAASTTVTIGASATCPSGTSPSYRFAYAPANSTNYTYLGDWGTANSATWNTTGIAPADYDLIVFVRASIATAGFDSLKKKTITVTPPPPCVVDTLSASPDGTVLVGTSVTASLTAHCPSGATPNYRLAYALAGTTNYTYLTGWGTAASVVWNTTGLAQNNYDLVGFVRPSTSSGVYEGLKTKAVGVRTQCTSGTLTVSPPSGGTVLTLTGGATCLEPRYSYYYAADDYPDNWTAIGAPWLTGATTLTVSSVPAGTYLLKMDARELTFGMGDTSATVNRQIGPGCYAVNSPGDYTGGHPHVAGEPVEFGDGVALCDPGVTPEYSFYYAPPAGAYQLFPGTDWQSDHFATLITSGFSSTGFGYATYSIQVRVRGVGHVGRGEVFADGWLAIDDP